MKKKKTIIVFIILLGCILTLGFYSLFIILQKNLEVKEGSFAYFLTISQEIQNTPLVEPMGGLRNKNFFYSASDGTKHNINGVRYYSGSSKKNIKEKTEDYLYQYGYIKPNEPIYDDKLLYENGKDTIEILIEDFGETSIKYVEVVQYY